MVTVGAATAVLKSRFIESAEIENQGSGFDPGPKVVFTSQVGAPSINAKAAAYVKNGEVTEIALLDAGEGYGSIPPRVTVENTPPISVADDSARLLTATYVTKGKPLAVNDIVLNVATSVKYKYLGHLPLSPTIVADLAGRTGITSPDDGSYCYQLDTPYSIYKYVSSAWTTLNLLAQEAAWSTRVVDATAEIILGPKTIQGATLTEFGMGYSTAPTVVFDGTQAFGDGREAGLIPKTAFAIANVGANQSVDFIEVKDGGRYYGTPPYVHFWGGRGSGATAEAVMSGTIIESVEIVNGGSAAPVPDITITVADPVSPPVDFVRAELLGKITAGGLSEVEVVNHGYGYPATPAVSVTRTAGGTGSGATVALTMSEARVVGLKVAAKGTGYAVSSPSDVPLVTISGGGTGAIGVATYGGMSRGSLVEHWFHPSPAFISSVGDTYPGLVPVNGIRGPIVTVHREKVGRERISDEVRNRALDGYTKFGSGGFVNSYKEYPTFKWGVSELTGKEVTVPVLRHAGYYQPSTGIFKIDGDFARTWAVPFKEEAMADARTLPEYSRSHLAMVPNANLDFWNVNITSAGSGYTDPKVVFTGGPPLIGWYALSHDYNLLGPYVHVGPGSQRKAMFKGKGYYAQFGVTPRLFMTPTATLTFAKAGNPTHVYNAIVDVAGGKVESITPTEPINLPAGYVATVSLSGISVGSGATYSNVTAPLYVVSASVGAAGTGYASIVVSGARPVVFNSGSLPGSGASAIAYFEAGVCKRVDLTSAGSGYIVAPSATVVTGVPTSVVLAVNLTQNKVLGVRITNRGTGYAPHRGIIQSSLGSDGEVDLVPAGGKGASCRVASPGLRYESGASVVFPLSEERHAQGDLRGYLDSSGACQIAVITGGSGYYEGTTAVMVGDRSEPVTLEIEAGTIKSARFTTQVRDLDVGFWHSEITRAPLVQAKAIIQTSPEYIAGVRVLSGGAGYNDSPTVVVESISGVGADISAAVSFDGKLEHVRLNSSGDGYGQTVTAKAGKVVNSTFIPNETAFIRPMVGGGYIDSFIITNGGEYNPATVTARVVGGGGTGAQATPVITNGRITAINITTKGQNYARQPMVDIRSDFGRGALALANTGGGSVSSVKILSAGTGFPTTPSLTVNAVATRNASVRPVLAGRGVGSVSITPYGGRTGGLGYVSAPAVTFSPPTDVPAGLNASDFTARGRAFVMRGLVVSIIIDYPGDHYSSAPTVTVADPPIGLSGLVSLDSSGLNTLFGIGGAPDVSVVNLNAEIAIVTGTSPNEVKMTTETFTLRVNNDIFR